MAIKWFGNIIFGNYQETVSFVNKIAKVAEEGDYHPEIDFTYERVLFLLLPTRREDYPKKILH